MWLGPGDEESNDLLAGQIAELVRLAREYEERLGPTGSLHAWDDSSPEWPMMQREVIGQIYEFASDWGPFLGVFRSQWWRRVWVIQEVVLASGDVWVYQGGAAFFWHDMIAAFRFALAVGLISPEGVLQDGSVSEILSVASMADIRDAVGNRSCIDSGDAGVMWVLHRIGSSLATDPRDMVYGILGVIQKAESKRSRGNPEPFVIPDYSLDPADVFQQVTEKLLARFPKLYALMSAGLKCGGGSVPGLPSWVIDWTDVRTRRAAEFHALETETLLESGLFGSGDPCLVKSHPKFFMVKDRALILSGFMIDEVEKCTDVLVASRFLPRRNKKNLPTTLQAMLHFGTLHEVMEMWQGGAPDQSRCAHTQEEFIRAVLTTLFRGNIPEALRSISGLEAIQALLDFAHNVAWLKRSAIWGSWLGIRIGLPIIGALAIAKNLSLFSKEDAGAQQGKLEAISEIGAELADRVPFKTHQGHIGVSNGLHVQESDCIVLVQGAAAPLILRRMEARRWTLIGDCYIYGIMDGEEFDVKKCNEICIV